MNLFSSTPKANLTKIRQIKTWVNQCLKIDSEIPISVNQLRCSEPGCPPLETVIAVMTTPARKYTIHKSVAEITDQDVLECLRQ